MYRTQMVPQASILTPNHYECELLTGITVHTDEDALRATSALHDLGAETVIITSKEPGAADGVTDDVKRKHGEVVMYASRRPRGARSHGGVVGEGEKEGERGGDAEVEGSSGLYRLAMDRHSGHYTGTGDLFAALLLAWTYKSPDDLPLALERAGATIQSVIRRTSESAPDAPPGACIELKLVASRMAIVEPVVVRRATRVGGGGAPSDVS